MRGPCSSARKGPGLGWREHTFFSALSTATSSSSYPHTRDEHAMAVRDTGGCEGAHSEAVTRTRCRSVTATRGLCQACAEARGGRKGGEFEPTWSIPVPSRRRGPLFGGRARRIYSPMPQVQPPPAPTAMGQGERRAMGHGERRAAAAECVDSQGDVARACTGWRGSGGIMAVAVAKQRR